MAKVYGNAGEIIQEGLRDYNTEVKERTFPKKENWFTMEDEEYEQLMDLLD
jgi:ketopantoate hydroxymethyltransferase